LKRRSFLQGLALAPGAAFGAEPAALPFYADIAGKAGVRFQCAGSPTSQKYLIETMVGGVAMFDYDGDGRLDLYFVNGAALADPMQPGKEPDKRDPKFWNRLYRNNGDGTFTDVTERAGVKGHSYGMGVAVGDFDNDGRPDLYVTNFGRNILYHNNGDGTFTDVTRHAGVGGGGWSVAACFVDYDKDGWLDLFVSRYLQWDFDNNPHCGEYKPGARGYCHPDQFKPVTHLLYHNNRDGTFTDVSKEAGIADCPGFGLGVTFNDFDRDGWPDLLVANDNLPQQLFRNLGNGKFKEVALDAGLAYDENGKTFSGMGVDFADYNNDGWPDVIIGALANERYAVFQNRNRNFVYMTEPSGLGAISSTHSAWGLKFFDYDNDGWKDLFAAQGHVMDNVDVTFPGLHYLEPPVMIRNNRGRFQDVSAQSGEPFRVARAARGAAFGDLDNDGQLEIAINVLNGPAMILKNQRPLANHWLIVDPRGTASNRDGIGAKVRVVSASGLEQHGLVNPAGSYASASDRRVHFGLGSDTVAEVVEVAWPSGTVQRLSKVPADQILTVTEPPPTKPVQALNVILLPENEG
jgi:enediyne biosynthesis protein E4